MRGWADLHQDLTLLIIKHLNSIEDYLAFSRVCPSWRLSAKKQKFNPSSSPQIPCILLLDNINGYVVGGPQDIYSLSLRKTIGKILLLPESLSVRYVECSVPVAESSSGWILRYLTPRCYRPRVKMTLINPFSRVEFPLPDFPISCLYDITIFKVALSKSPIHVSDFEITFLVSRQLFYWKVGNEYWTQLRKYPRLRHEVYDEIKYHNGKLYAINRKGRVDVFRSESQALVEPVLVELLPSSCDLRNAVTDIFLVEKSTETLLVVWKNFDDPVFYVYELDVISGGGCKEVRDLEGKSIFMGNSYSSLVEVSGKVEANKIYFSQKYVYFDQITVHAYNMEDRSMVTYYSSSHHQPVFINPTLC